MRLNLSRMVKAWTIAAMAVAAMAVFCAPASAANDIIVNWTFEAGTSGNPPLATASDITGISPAASPVAPTGSTASGHHATATTAWTNPVGNATPDSFSANNWQVNDYYQFKSSTTGFTDIGLIFETTGSSTGPKDFKVQYSTNGTTFIDSGLTYAVTAESWSSAGTPNDLSKRGIDLRPFAVLNNATDVYFRMVDNSTASVSGGTVATTGTNRLDNFQIVSNFEPLTPPPPPPTPRLPQGNDIVFGLNSSSATRTLELVAGPASLNGGVVSGTPWQTTSLMESIRFDNFGGQGHNAHGNLLGLKFSAGQIYSFGTQGSIPVPAGQLIGNTGATSPVGQDGSLPSSSLGALSVSPLNNRIAVSAVGSTGTTPVPGGVYIYDYTAGDAHGAGASLTNGRAATGTTLNAGVTQGVTWVDNNTVVAFSSTGGIYTVNATDMSSSFVTGLPVPVSASNQTSITFNPDVSPYVWALFSGFSDPTTKGRLYILDPTNNYAQVGSEINLDARLNACGGATPCTTGDTPRELALDAAGNLYISGFGSTIDVLPNAAAHALTQDIDASTLVRWYKSTTFASFNGLDVGFGTANIAGDYNSDSVVDARDYVLWRKNPGSYGGDPAGYNAWRTNYGTGAGAGASLSGAAVPEPASIVLMLVGLVGFGLRRRSA